MFKDNPQYKWYSFILIAGAVITAAICLTNNISFRPTFIRKSSLNRDANGNLVLTFTRDSTFVDHGDGSYTSRFVTQGGTTIYLYDKNSSAPGDNYVAKVNSGSANYLTFSSDTSGTPFRFQGLKSLSVTANLGLFTPTAMIYSSTDYSDYGAGQSMPFTSGATQTLSFDKIAYYLKLTATSTMNIISISLTVTCL